MAMVSDAEVKNYDFSTIKQIMTTGVVISSAIANKIMQLPHLERIITVREMQFTTEIPVFSSQSPK